jgi:hypothetical protein
MFFDLLEALIRHDTAKAKELVGRLLHEQRDARTVLGTFYTTAARHDPSHRPGPDAVCVVSAVDTLLQDGSENWTAESEFFVLHCVEFLSEIRTVEIDSSVLKPDLEDFTAVSVHELDEAFQEPEVGRTFETVRRLLSAMDNKQYFMELMIILALKRTPASIVLARSTQVAIQTMGWHNHFVPFLLCHLVSVLHREAETTFADRISETPEVELGRAVAQPHFPCDYFYLTCLYRALKEMTLNARRAEPLVSDRLRDAAERPAPARLWAVDPEPWMNDLFMRSSRVQLATIVPEEQFGKTLHE